METELKGRETSVGEREKKVATEISMIEKEKILLKEKKERYDILEGQLEQERQRIKTLRSNL